MLPSCDTDSESARRPHHRIHMWSCGELTASLYWVQKSSSSSKKLDYRRTRRTPRSWPKHSLAKSTPLEVPHMLTFQREIRRLQPPSACQKKTNAVMQRARTTTRTGIAFSVSSFNKKSSYRVGAHQSQGSLSTRRVSHTVKPSDLSAIRLALKSVQLVATFGKSFSQDEPLCSDFRTRMPRKRLYQACQICLLLIG